jgi:hypothetical protein
MSEGTQVGTIPAIDFETHPGFRNLNVEQNYNDATARQLLGDIERECESISLSGGSSKHRLLMEFRSKIQPKFEKLKNIAIANESMDPRFRDYASQAIERASEFLLEDLHSRLNAPKRGEVPPAKEGDAYLLALVRDGFCRFPLGTSLAQRVWRNIWWERWLMRRRARLTPGRHCALALDNNSPGSLLIQRALFEKGVLEMVSQYMSQRMAFLYAALDYSHERQNWYKDCYADVGLATSKTAYMHFDADSGIVKAMLYLKNVQPENGPFRYVRRSHRWERSAVQCAIDRGFDAQQTKTFELESDGLDYKLGYYRPRYKLSEWRKGLLMLPKILRGSTHFGDDVVDGSPLSESLLQQEEIFVGPAGTFVIFDGAKGIHRGSQVDHGERWAVQIGMRVAEDKEGEQLPPTARPVVSRLRYELGRAKNVLRTWLGK